MRLFRYAALGASLLAGCPSQSPVDAGAKDAGAKDAGLDAGPGCSPNLPRASDVCLEGQCGNELGVGQPCTEGGGECSDLGSGNAILCTADFSDDELEFCTKPCVVDEDCGTGAVCARDPADPGAGAGCLPVACYAPPPDAGSLDAGASSAHPADAAG